MKDLPLPEVTEIKPVDQWADKLYAQTTAPATVQMLLQVTALNDGSYKQVTL